MTAGVAERPDRVLLVWDAPNMDMSLGSLLGARPTSAFRPRFDAVGRWLLDVAGATATAEACVGSPRTIAMRVWPRPAR